MTGGLHATRDALDWLPPFPASDVVNQARSAALAEVELAENVIEAARAMIPTNQIHSGNQLRLYQALADLDATRETT